MALNLYLRSEVKRGLPVLFLTFILLLICAGPAFAVQTHGGSEGLVAHQIGHLLLIAACVILVFHSRRLLAEPGWRHFRLFLLLLIAWNLLTFVGHGLDEVIPSSRFLLDEGRRVGMLLTGPDDLLFYLTRLDHLLLVPAFWFLWRATEGWRRP